MFRQIYELTVLGMHPASLYPRRSQVAPNRRAVAAIIIATAVVTISLVYARGPGEERAKIGRARTS